MSRRAVDVDAITAVIQEVASEIVRPRFRSLAAGDIEEKAPGDYVTIADRECEAALTERLRSLVDVPVLGEEAAAADPGLVDRLTAGDGAWIVDPVDGTANFAGGSPDHAVMVALAQGDEVTHSWIHQPEHELTFVAERGSGARRNGEVMTLGAASADPFAAPLDGIAKRKYLPADRRDAVVAAIDAVGTRAPNPGCCGVEYPLLLTGAVDYLLYWLTYPWDHAPGVLLLSEAGGAALRPNGSPYRWNDRTDGLIVTHRSMAAELTSRLFGSNLESP